MYKKISELAGKVERVRSSIENTPDSRLIKMQKEVLEETIQRLEKEIIFAGEKLVEEGQNLSEVERKILQWMIKHNPDSPWIETHRELLKRAIQRIKETQRFAEETRKRAKEVQRLVEEERKHAKEAEEERKRTEEEKNRLIMEKESYLRTHPIVIYKNELENPWLPRKHKS